VNYIVGIHDDNLRENTVNTSKVRSHIITAVTMKNAVL
jgi:hypothetical protein